MLTIEPAQKTSKHNVQSGVVLSLSLYLSVMKKSGEAKLRGVTEDDFPLIVASNPNKKRKIDIQNLQKHRNITVLYVGLCL